MTVADSASDPGIGEWVRRWWPIFVLGGGLLVAAVRAETELAYTKGRVERLEITNAMIVKDASFNEREIRNALGQVQLQLARICAKIDAKCD